MLTIRLQRAGKKNRADYRIILADKTAAAQKKFTEILGTYNPHTKAVVIRDQERMNYWIDEQHVELSATVRNLLVSKELIKGDKTKAFTIPKKEVVAEEAPSEAPAAAPAADAETPATEETASEEVAPATEEVAPVEEAPAEAVAEAIEEKTPEAIAEPETPAEEAPKEEEKPQE